MITADALAGGFWTFSDFSFTKTTPDAICLIPISYARNQIDTVAPTDL